jgi:hypothetical protein
MNISTKSNFLSFQSSGMQLYSLVTPKNLAGKHNFQSGSHTALRIDSAAFFVCRGPSDDT